MSQTYFSRQEEIFLRKPYIQNYFSQTSPEHSHPEYSLKVSKDGEKIVFFHSKPLASTYNPTKQAERSIDSKKIKTTDLIIVCGLGNPCILKKLHTLCPENQIVILIDIAKDLVPLLWEEILSEFLSIPGRHIFSGEEFMNLLWNYLDGLNPDKLTGLKFIENPDSLNLNKEFYRSIQETILNIFTAKMSSLLTKFEFENLWISNILFNTIQFNPNKMSLIRIYENLLSNIPGVLVSAGPSLREQIPWIREIRDKVFLMACDTAVKVLLSHNIKPDAVFTLDAQLNSIFHFLGTNLEGIACIADMVASPYLLSSIPMDPILFSMTARFVYKADGSMEREITSGGEFAEKYLGIVGDIQSGGSVATSAFEALRFMGVREFFFFGQDLAYTGREIHSTGTHHNENWIPKIHRKKSLEWINESIIRKRDTKYVESVNGGVVITDFVLDLYKNWFEESVKTLKQRDPMYRFVNFSEKGAKIEGMENLSPKKAPEIFATYPNHNYPWRNSWNPKSTSTPPKNEKPSQDLVEDLQMIVQNIPKWSLSDHWYEELNSWFEKRPYLKKTVRKTEVYLLRNQSSIPEEKKKSMYLETLKKEILKLRRKLYPILGDFLSEGYNKASS